MTLSARKIPYQFLAMPALVLVAGCASTGGGGGGTMPPPGPVYSEEAGTVHEALEGGTALHAYNSAMTAYIVEDWEADERRLGTEHVGFSIADNGDGTYSVTIDGQTTVFTPGPGDDSFRLEDGDRILRDVWLNNGDFQAFLEGYGGRNYHTTWNYWWRTGEDQGLSGHAVVGTETSADYLAGQASATYEGGATARFRSVDTENDDQFQIWGDLVLNADFAAGQISGEVNNLEREERIGGGDWSDQVAIDGTVTFEQGTITGNQFSGAISEDVDDTFEGTYQGKFFGPKANEVGGVISGTGPGVVGTGVFSGERE